MRDEDLDESSTAARHNELRDIHHRIDALKEESERQHSSLTEKLHALEVAVVRGNRFPAAAWVAAAGIFLTIIGTGFITFNKLETAATSSAKAISLIETHMAGSSARFQSIQDATAFMGEWEKRLPLLDERIKGLESRIVGQGPEGWHRRDHELYAQMIDERFNRLKSQVNLIEAKQERLCERVRECKK